MPDPTVSDALAEAYALAPADELILHTIEVRHPAFVDDEGASDSIWVVRDERDWLLTIEDDAPIKGGQSVLFRAMAFEFTLPDIEPGSTQEIEVSLDGVSRLVAEQVDMAVTEVTPITMVYRPYLSSDTATPQMNPAPSFELADVRVGVLTVRARARLAADLRVAFPRRLYTAAEFPGLIRR